MGSTKSRLPQLHLKPREKMRSFCIHDVFEKHYYMLNFRQKSYPFSDSKFCTDIMMGSFRKDNFITFSESTQPRVTNESADASTGKIGQSKW